MDKPLTILVVGDAMEDVYWCGTSTRISPEAPIPVVKIERKRFFPGGAANVATNLFTMGATVVEVYGYGQIRKHRLMVGDHQLARWDEKDSAEPIPLWKPKWAAREVKLDAVVVADYLKGSVYPELVQELLTFDLPIYVDTKGDPTAWLEAPNVTLFPNWKEWLQWEEQYLKATRVLLKRGADGLEYWQEGGFVKAALSRPLRVVSVNGAGDTVLAAYVMAELMPQLDPLRWAAGAGELAVEKPYTSTVTLQEISERILCPVH